MPRVLGRQHPTIRRIRVLRRDPARRHAESVILQPVFCAGATALGAKLHDIMPDRRRTATVLEVAATAQAVQAFLDAAPIIRRGRPKS